MYTQKREKNFSERHFQKLKNSQIYWNKFSKKISESFLKVKKLYLMIKFRRNLLYTLRELLRELRKFCKFWSIS